MFSIHVCKRKKLGFEESVEALREEGFVKQIQKTELDSLLDDLWAQVTLEHTAKENDNLLVMTSIYNLFLIQMFSPRDFPRSSLSMRIMVYIARFQWYFWN